jgi:diguanylate cyclase (GGDEF)-like protein
MVGRPSMIPSMLPAPRRFALSVAGRVLLFTVTVWVGLLGGLHIVLSNVFHPTFVRIETGLMTKDLERIEAAMAREVQQLGSTADDYASWDDMREYIDAGDAGEAPRALKPEILKTLDLDALFVFDELGRVKYSLLDKDAASRAHVKEYTPAGFASQFPVIASVRTGGADESSSQQGLVRFKTNELVLAAAAPVVSSKDNKRALGTVVLLRELDARYIERLAEQVRLPLKLVAADPTGPAVAAKDAKVAVLADKVVASAWLRDPFGQPIAEFIINRPATILEQGEETLNVGGVGSLVMLSLVLAMLLLLLQLSVVRPLRSLTRSIENVRRTADLGVRVGINRGDEIGLLAYNFDRLLELLQQRTKVLEELATTDGLTKLRNRRTCMDELGRLIEAARNDPKPLSVLLLDVDHFKRINDTVGHSVGDRVLREVAKLLKSSLRSSDTGGRYGGEEFLVLLPNTGKSEAIVIGERIRSSIAASKIQGLDWPVTVSVGVANWVGHTAHGLLATADMNLYRAKEGGRNCVIAEDIPLSRLPAASIPPPGQRVSLI